MDAIDAVQKKVPVLYIGGWSRSGSTIVGSILGQLPGFFYVGELSNIWTRGVLDNAPCGCGTRFRDCEMWAAVFQRAFGGVDERFAKQMLALRKHWPNNKLLLLRGALGRDGLSRLTKDPAAVEYAERLRRLYRALAEYNGERVIVDSSKVPSYAFVVGQLPSVDLRLVHLVRDPRATTYSWLRHIDRSDAGRDMSMERLAIWQSSAQWTTWNAATVTIAKVLSLPSMRLTYESFVKEPRQAIESILAFVRDLTDGVTFELPFESTHDVRLRSTHNVWGNPRRQRSGRVAIIADNEWETGLTSFARAVVAGLTYPLARRYGYYRK
jgi:hypothetical protein